MTGALRPRKKSESFRFQLLSFQWFTPAVLNGVDLDGIRGLRRPQWFGNIHGGD
jgi:hypothetical protein